MISTIGTPLALFTDLAALLARGYLRASEKAEHCAVSGRREPQKELDLRAEESPPVIETGAPHGNNDAS